CCLCPSVRTSNERRGVVYQPVAEQTHEFHRGQAGTARPRTTRHPHNGEGEILNRTEGSLRSGVRSLFTLHVSHPPLPGYDGSSPPPALPGRWEACLET